MNAYKLADELDSCDEPMNKPYSDMLRQQAKEIEALKKELDTANKSYMWRYEAMNTNQQWFEAQEYWGDDKDEGWVSQHTFNTLEEARAFAEKYFINNHPWRVIQCSDIYIGQVDSVHTIKQQGVEK